MWDTWQSDTDFWKCNHRRPSMSARSQKIGCDKKKVEWWFIIICRDSSLGDKSIIVGRSGSGRYRGMSG